MDLRIVRISGGITIGLRRIDPYHAAFSAAVNSNAAALCRYQVVIPALSICCIWAKCSEVIPAFLAMAAAACHATRAAPPSATTVGVLTLKLALLQSQPMATVTVTIVTIVANTTDARSMSASDVERRRRWLDTEVVSLS